jgi:opacity protein-like surface antigen
MNKEKNTMIRKTILTAMVVAVAAATASAQDGRVEISGTAGWTFSDGVNVGSSDNAAIRVDPKDAFSWGARLGFNLTPNVEVGGLFNLQKTDLEASGVIDRSVPQSIYNYHGYFAYNFGDTDASVRPYVLGGLGATQYGSLTTAVGEIGGETQFSTTWAAGLKLFPSPNFGIRLEGRWTPTYIKTDPEGYWCDPYWGCFTVGEAEYANQYELSGGIILRF